MSLFSVAFRVCILIVTACLLQSCQPAYTIDQSQGYARELGLTHRYEISRWNNLVLDSGSSFTVVGEAKDGINSAALAEEIAKQFSFYFDDVRDDCAQNRHHAIKATKHNASNYLLYVRVVEFDALFHPDNPSKATRYDHLLLTVSVVDAVSSKTIDKITVAARSPFYNAIGSDIDTLLSNPIRHIATQLKGT